MLCCQTSARLKAVVVGQKYYVCWLFAKNKRGKREEKSGLRCLFFRKDEIILNSYP